MTATADEYAHLLIDSYSNRRERIRTLLFRLSVRVLLLYLFLYLIQVTGLYYVEFLVSLDLLLYFEIVLLLVTVSVYIDSGELSPNVEKGIQYAFLGSLIALALLFSSVPPLPDVTKPVQGYAPKLLNLAICTGVLTAVSVRTNEVSVRFLPDGRVRGGTFRTTTLRKEHYAGLLVLAILVYFVFLRWPFLGKTFGGTIHSDKFGRYVPVVEGMVQTGNPFYFRNPAYASIFDQNAHVFDGLWNVPIFSWSVLPLALLGPDLGIEFLSRSVLTIQGIFMLVAIFVLLREIFDLEIALFGLLLVGVNEVFNLVSYVMVMDLPALVFAFTSIVLFWRDKKTYSYLFCGFAVLLKYSFLLISVPVLAILILSNVESELYNSMKLGYFTFAPTLLFGVLVTPVAGASILVGGLRLALFVALLAVSIVVFERYESTLIDLESGIDKRVRYAVLVLLPLFGIALLWDKIVRYAPTFLTDRHLLFNVAMYSEMIDRIRRLQPNLMFYLAPLGVGWLLLRDDWKQRIAIIGLTGAAVSYTVIASKSVFIHAYYKHVMVLVCIVGFLGVLDVLRRLDVSGYAVQSAITGLLLLLVVSSQAQTVDLLDNELRGTEEMGEYIDQNVPESALIGRTQALPQLLVFYSDARFVWTTSSTFPPEQRATLRSEIESKGFGVALRERNVTYYLSHGPGEFGDFEYLLADGLETWNRRDYILQKVDPTYSVRWKSNNVSSPEGFFELETQIGEWYLYKVKKECSTDEEKQSGRQCP